MDGWWLCSLRGRTAIAPGNYFVILTPEQQQLLYAKMNAYETSTTQSPRRSPQRSGSSAGLPVGAGASFDTYDTPPMMRSATLPRGVGGIKANDRFEATEMGNKVASGPPPPSASVRSSTSADGSETYDVLPASRSRRLPSVADVDPPYTELSEDEERGDPREIDVSASVALKRLGQIQQKQIDPNVKRLNASVTKHWLRAETVHEKVDALVPIGSEIKAGLRELDRFCFDLTANAEKATDRTLKTKLDKLRAPVDETRRAIREIVKALRREKSDVATLQDNLQDLVSTAMRLPQDVRELVVFVRVNSSLLFKSDDPATGAPDSPRSSRADSTADVSSQFSGGGGGPVAGTSMTMPYFRSGLDSSSLSASMDSISDASMSSKRNSIADPSPQHPSPRVKTPDRPPVDETPPPPPPARRSSGSLRGRALSEIALSPGQLSTSEKALLSYYSVHMQTLFPDLTQSVQHLCAAAKGEPNEFVPKAKYVIVSAYKLVYIADALFQKILHVQLRNHVVHCSNKLSDAIKQVVDFTKRAALDYPSKYAVQKMVESISLVPEAARALADSIKEGSEM